jgi:tRNA(fMet)-specific endonuclease VapC
MIEYLLDANVISDFVHGEAGVKTRLRATAPDSIAISTITLMELEYGLALDSRRAREIALVVREMVADLTVIPFSMEDARAAASVRAALRKRARPIGPYDVLLAGAALARGLTFVTANTTEFRRVSGLALENWRAPGPLGA